MKRLRTEIKDLFGDRAEIYVFGSMAQELYLHESDIDVYLEFESD